MKIFFILFISLLPIIGLAQEEKKFGINFSGFVKSDIFFDSRETVDVREGHFLLYPQNEVLDPEGNDRNANPKFHILSIQTRLKGTITGPDALGAKTSAVMEGEFFGTSDTELNGFRLRHAFIQLKWTNTQFLVGQYWHPMFNTSCFPGTVSFNTGAPFEPFSRNTQLRITQFFGDYSLAFTAMSQKDFMSTCPGGASTIYLRNTVTPAMNLTFQYKHTIPETVREILAGVSLNFKTIRPQTESDSGYQAKTNMPSFGFSAFLKYACKPFTVKLHDYYGGDAFNLTMLGGYAVNEITDMEKGYVSYAPIYNNSTWFEIHTNGKTWQYGLFAGYTKNLGSPDPIIGRVYSRGSNIDHVWRASGRVIFNAGKFRVAPEIEYTTAAYALPADDSGLAIDEYGKITDSKEVANVRLLLGVFTSFNAMKNKVLQV